MARSDELRFRAGDVTLVATLMVPDDADASAGGRLPWALLIGSWLPRDRDGAPDRERHPGWYRPPRRDEPAGLLARMADALAGVGVASLRYDPRGCGESGGAWEASSLFTRIDDARDAIGAMRSRRDLDLRRTALVGHGEGAGIALSVAIGDPAISAVGLVGASARSFRDVLRRAVAERERTGVDRDHPVVAALDRSAEELIERVERRERAMTLVVGTERVRLELAGWEQAVHTPTLALATMLHRNVVLAHGSADAWTSVDETRLLASIFEAGGIEPMVQVIPDAGHDLAEADDGRVAEFAAALAGRIEARSLPPVLAAIEEMGSTSG